MAKPTRRSPRRAGKDSESGVRENEHMFESRQPFLWSEPPATGEPDSPKLPSPRTNAIRRARAVNFAMLVGVFGSERKAEDAWVLLERLYSVDSPFDDEALRFIAKANVDVRTLEAKLKRFQEAQRALETSDLILERGDPLYPRRLLESGDAPRFLYLRQSDGILDRPSLAVVGTRNPTREGALRARKLAALLAKHSVVVVSGLAKGIDTAAHIGCIEAGGQTVGVIGTPLTQTYPKENAALQQSIGETGALVSQFAPGSNVTRLNFPLRNATMSGLTLGTVVIEASETSGALIQARRALQQGRRLFIPRSALENESLSWPRTYAQRGAIVFSDIDELVASLGLKTSIGSTNGSKTAVSLSA